MRTALVMAGGLHGKITDASHKFREFFSSCSIDWSPRSRAFEQATVQRHRYKLIELRDHRHCETLVYLPMGEHGEEFDMGAITRKLLELEEENTTLLGAAQILAEEVMRSRMGPVCHTTMDKVREVFDIHRAREERRLD